MDESGKEHRFRSGAEACLVGINVVALAVLLACLAAVSGSRTVEEALYVLLADRARGLPHLSLWLFIPMVLWGSLVCLFPSRWVRVMGVTIVVVAIAVAARAYYLFCQL